MDYMRENCARTCGFCIVGDLNDRPNELLNETAGGSGTATTDSAGGGTTAGAASTSSTASDSSAQTIASIMAKSLQQQKMHSGMQSRILERKRRDTSKGLY